MGSNPDKKRPCVLVTRPILDSQQLAPQIEAMGADVLISPVIDIKECDFECPSFDGYDAICVTSANALRILAKKTPLRNVKIYCVGKNTAHEAQKMGFKEVLSANNSAESLFNLIQEGNLRKLLYFSAKEPSFPLQECLQDADIVCDVITAYESQAVHALTEEAIDALRSDNIDFALFYSRKSAENFMTIIKREELYDSLKSIKALCLSDGVVESLQAKRWAECAVCDVSNGDAMMDLLAQKLAKA